MHAEGKKKKKRNKNKKRKISEIDPADEQPKKKQNTKSDVNKSYLDVFGPNAKPDLTLKLEAVKKNDIKIRVSIFISKCHHYNRISNLFSGSIVDSHLNFPF